MSAAAAAAAAVRVGVRSAVPGLAECITARLDKRQLERPVQIVESLVDRPIEESLRGVCVVVTDPDVVASVSADAGAARGVRWIQSTWAGVEKFRLPASSEFRKDVVVTRVGSGFGQQMAEFVVGFVLQECLLVGQMRADQRTRTWNATFHKQNRRSLAGMTLGILGAGAIGHDIARSAKALGMRSIGLVSSTHRADGATPDAFAPLGLTTDLATVLGHADVVVNCLPSTPATRGLLSADTFALARSSSDLPSTPASSVGGTTTAGDTAGHDAEGSASGEVSRRAPLFMFINVGRGDVISEAELVKTLDLDLVQHAVLDVLPVEPLPASSALWNHPRVTISPHVSAVSTPDIVARVFVENLDRFLPLLPPENSSGSGDGEDAAEAERQKSIARELRHVVDLSKGY